jgi:hypothetical protein
VSFPMTVQHASLPVQADVPAPVVHVYRVERRGHAWIGFYQGDVP